MPSRRGRVRALGDRGPGGHSAFLCSLAKTLESRNPWDQVWRLSAGWGSLSQSENLSLPGGVQA